MNENIKYMVIMIMDSFSIAHLHDVKQLCSFEVVTVITEVYLLFMTFILVSYKINAHCILEVTALCSCRLHLKHRPKQLFNYQLMISTCCFI